MKSSNLFTALKLAVTLAGFLLLFHGPVEANQAIESETNKALLEEAAELKQSGAQLEASGRYLEATPVIQKRLHLLESIYGPFHPELARGLNDLANIEQRLGNYERALLLRQRVVLIFERSEGRQSINTAVALGNLGAIYRNMGRPEAALTAQKQGLEIVEEISGPRHQDNVAALYNLAQIELDMGNFANARDLQIRAISILGDFNQGDSLNSSLLFNDLGVSYDGLASYADSLSSKSKALKIVKEKLGEFHPFVARMLSNLAVTYFHISFFDKALELQIQALAIQEKNFENGRLDLANTLNNISVTYSRLGDYEKAIVSLSRALEIRKELLGSEHPETVTTQLNIANNYLILKRYDEALSLQLRAVDVLEKRNGAVHKDTAVALNNLSHTYSFFGNYEKAIELQSRSVNLQEQLTGQRHPDFASALSNLAAIYYDTGRFQKALEEQKRALEIRRMVFLEEHVDIANSLNNLAVTYSVLGNLEEALTLQLEALRIFENSYGSRTINVAQILGNLASSYGLLGAPDKALPLLLRSLSIYEERLGRDNTLTAKSSFNLARYFLSSGQTNFAITLFKDAVNVYQGAREIISKIGQGELKSYTSTIAQSYQELAQVLIDDGRLSEAQQVLDMLKEDEQFEFIRRASDADPRSSRIGYTGTEQAWLKRYREIADRLGKLGAEERELEKQAKLGLTAEQKQMQQAILADLKVAQTAFQLFLGEMRKGFAQKGQARKVEVEEVSAQAIRESQNLLKGLGDDVALVQYYITDKRVGMILTTPGIQLARSSTIDSKELNRKIGELRRLLQDPKSNPVSAAQELYRILVAPVAQDLEQANAKTVMLSLDGALRYLPFGALHDGKQYLVDRWNLPMYTSVTRNKLRDTVSPQWQAAGLGVTKAWPEFKPLAGVKAEMGAIVKTAAGGFMPGEVYLDEAFTAKTLKDVSQRKFPLMHVASHFRFSPGTEVNSFLLLGDGEHLTLGDIRTQNYRFDNVDLLTLSACDTGLGGGRDEQGKEIEGFGVIAQQQGAKAVLATLWPVADQSTATLMADMYRRRQSDSLTKIEALRKAQIALQTQSKYAHPYYWAPFILMGNWK